MTTAWPCNRSPCCCRLAGKKPAEAVQNFLSPLQVAATCVTSSVFRPDPDGYSAGCGHSLILNKGEFVTLAGPDRLQLAAALEYDVVRLDDPPPGAEGPWKVRTRAYRYHVVAQDLAEVALWHWHPGGSSKYIDPHMHIGRQQILPDAVISRATHHPTGRIAFEQVLQQLIQEFGIEPRRDDWNERLEESLARFAEWRTWP